MWLLQILTTVPSIGSILLVLVYVVYCRVESITALPIDRDAYASILVFNFNLMINRIIITVESSEKRHVEKSTSV